MIIVSSHPLVVLFHEGHAILDRFDRKISLEKATIPLEKIKNYLIKDGSITNYSFNLMMNKIK